jgi:hypothetical protein
VAADGGEFSDDEGDAGMFWGDDGDNDYEENIPQDGPVGHGMDEGVAVDEDRRGSRMGGLDSSFQPFEDTDEDLARRVEKALDESLNQQQGNYENICKQHINNFMLGAETYARETQLSKRVTEWTRRLEPLLRAQEDAPEYDIHTYSDLVLSQVGTVVEMDHHQRFSLLGIDGDDDIDEEGHRRCSNRRVSVQQDSGLVDFSEVVGFGGVETGSPGPSSAEVCRVFLACLMLANMGSLDVIPSSSLLFRRTSQSNIRNRLISNSEHVGRNSDIHNQKDMEMYSKEMTSFGVRLLSSSRRHDIEKFRAPSVTK